jgi:hypothetical protein
VTSGQILTGICRPDFKPERVAKIRGNQKRRRFCRVCTNSTSHATFLGVRGGHRPGREISAEMSESSSASEVFFLRIAG